MIRQQVIDDLYDAIELLDQASKKVVGDSDLKTNIERSREFAKGRLGKCLADNALAERKQQSNGAHA